METARTIRVIRGRVTRNCVHRHARAIVVGMLAVSVSLLAFFGRSIAATETVIHTFTGGSDGQYPEAGLAIDSNGVLYGTTSYGGLNAGGTVFALAPPTSPGGAWTERILKSLGFDSGENPTSSLTLSRNGR